ncbi:MAG: sulfatase-like hydrolase/transferase [Oscillospiraceae bacterium]
MKHLLILFTDQQRYDTIAAFGNPQIQTPHLDALAKDSVVFERCITPSPVCVPARLSMLSVSILQGPAATTTTQTAPTTERDFMAVSRPRAIRSCCVGKLHNLWDVYGPMGFDSRHSQEEIAAEGDEYMRDIRKISLGV